MFQAHSLELPRLRPVHRLRGVLTHPLARGLVAAWLFTEGAGDQAYNFVEPGRHTAIIDLAGSAISGRSPWGPAADLSGTRFYAVPHHADINMQGDMTLICWVRPVDTAARTYLEKGNSGVSPFAAYGFVSAAGPEWRFIHGSAEVAPSGIAPVANVWQHLALVRTVGNTTITYSVNGEKRAAVSYGATAPANATASLGIGSRGGAGGPTFSGAQWGSVLLYNRALNAGEVALLYAGLPFVLADRDFFMLGPFLVLAPAPATMKAAAVTPAVVLGGLTVAPTRATIRLGITNPAAVGVEAFRKLVAADPGWAKMGAAALLTIPIGSPPITKATFRAVSQNPVVSLGSVQQFVVGLDTDWHKSQDGITLTAAGQANFAHIWMSEYDGLTLLKLFSPTTTQVDKSVNGGDTFVTLPTALPRAHANACMVHRSTGAILVALAASVGLGIQLARSLDEGTSWTTITVDGGFLNERLSARTFCETSDGSILASPDGNTVAARVYRSTDGGASWTTVYAPGSEIGRFFAVMHITKDNISFLQWSTSIFGNTRLSRSIDNGLTWAQVHSSGNEPRAAGVEFRNCVGRTPTGVYKFFDSPGGASLQWWESTNQGATWTALTGSAQSQNTNSLGHSPVRLWLSHDPTTGQRLHRGETPDAHPGTWTNLGLTSGIQTTSYCFWA